MRLALRRWSKLKKLSNGAYVETGLSANSVYRFCENVFAVLGRSPSSWHVTCADSTVDDDGDEDDDESGKLPSSELQALRLEFWVQVRAALVATGQFASLPTSNIRRAFDVRLGRSGVSLVLWARGSELVGVRLIVTHRMVGAFEILHSQREAIEKEVGLPLEWNPTWRNCGR